MKAPFVQKHPIKGIFFYFISLIWMLSGCQVSEFSETASPMANLNVTPSPSSSTISTISETTSDKVLTLQQWTDRWLIHPPCMPPCWEGVTPGETTADQALELYRNNPLFSKVEIYEGTNYVQILLYWHVQLEDGSVQELIAYSSYARTDTRHLIKDTYFGTIPTRLGQVIEAFGKPSHVKTTTEFGETIHVEPFTESIDNDEISLWSVNLVWADKGFTFGLVRKPPVLPIDENLALDLVEYLLPGIENFEKHSGTSSFGFDFLSVWKGYADYEVYMHPNPEP